jgi:hypothetical protein
LGQSVIDRDEATRPVPRIYSPEEKRNLRQGLMSGRSSLDQQSLLAKLGVPREKSIAWTKHRASQEITKRLEKSKRSKAPARGLIRANSQPPKGAPAATNRSAAHTGLATPSSELLGGRGNHQNPPQVNSPTEKAPAPRV